MSVLGDGDGVVPLAWFPVSVGELGFVEGVCVSDGLLVDELGFVEGVCVSDGLF